MSIRIIEKDTQTTTYLLNLRSKNDEDFICATKDWSTMKIDIPTEVLGKALEEEDSVDGVCDLLEYIMDLRPVDAGGEWHVDLFPVMAIDPFKEHMINMFRSEFDDLLDEEYEDE